MLHVLAKLTKYLLTIAALQAQVRLRARRFRWRTQVSDTLEFAISVEAVSIPEGGHRGIRRRRLHLREGHGASDPRCDEQWRHTRPDR